METGNLFERYSASLAGLPLPLAWIDLDALEANAAALSVRADTLPLRLATKSVRSVAVLRHVLERFPGFRGLMAYSAAEAALLHAQGFEDLLVAYPTLEAADVGACVPAWKAGARLTLMVDHEEHLHFLQEIAAKQDVVIPVCLDLDLSTNFPGLRFGVWRSPLRTQADLVPLLRTLKGCPNLRLDGLMGYEAQLAGVADDKPGAPVYNTLVRTLKRISQAEAFARRQTAVAFLRSEGFDLRFVNGGGTGSVEATRTDPSVTEITVGSGLYSPTLFDHYRDFRHRPAAGFALPVVRQARPDVWACSGGGYIASGGIDRDKEPQPWLPEGLSLFPTLGAGEVQTSVRSKRPLRLGQPVFFRHAKAGELLERFPHVHLIRGDRVEATVPTYRGQGWNFF